MKGSICAFVATVICVALVGTAVGQDLQQPTSLRETAFTRDYYRDLLLDQPSPSDLPATELEPENGCAAVSACGCENGCPSVCCCDGGGLFGAWCNLGDPWTLFGTHDATGITGGGWFQIGYTTYNTGQFNNHPYSVDLHQAWIYAERPVDTSAGGWDWGFRMDYVYGTDGPDTQAYGNRPNTWDFGWNNGNFYGHAIPQLYLELAYNDLSLKLGHFYTILGYEVVIAPGNFFYSHSFTMYNSEPFTHTGLLATYSVSDEVDLFGGWAEGWDTGFDSFGGDIFLGGLSVPLAESVQLIYALTAGNIGFGTNSSGYSHSVVIDAGLTDSLTYVFQTDYVSYTGFNTIGVNQYLFYSLSDCVALGARFEWWQPKLAPGDNADLYELTLGINIKPHSNLIFRPEVRWDKDNDAVLIPAAHNDRFGFGMDMILTF